MNDEKELLESIRRLVGAKQHRVRIHAVRHMIEEGFSEENILSALAGKSKLIENYPEDSRRLILGYFNLSDNVRAPLHLVCDYSAENSVDIITVYIPQKPWWLTPTRRGKL